MTMWSLFPRMQKSFNTHPLQKILYKNFFLNIIMSAYLSIYPSIHPQIQQSSTSLNQETLAAFIC